MSDAGFSITLADQDLDAALIREDAGSPHEPARLVAARVHAAQAGAAAATRLAEAIDRLAEAITEARH